jgi:hypothetical protein
MVEGGPNGVSNFPDSIWKNTSPYLRIEALRLWISSGVGNCRLIADVSGSYKLTFLYVFDPHGAQITGKKHDTPFDGKPRR